MSGSPSEGLTAAVDTVDIIAVEDSDVDFAGLERALRRTRPELRIARCRNGDEALARLLGDRPQTLPSLVLLDLNLPGTDGREVLLRLRADSRLDAIPILVLTTSSNRKDVDRCYAAGANGYLFKPVDYALFEATIRGAVDYWLSGSGDD